MKNRLKLDHRNKVNKRVDIWMSEIKKERVIKWVSGLKLDEVKQNRRKRMKEIF